MKVDKSPFYRLDREQFYSLQWHYFNNSEVTDNKQVSIKVGISQTDTQTFSTQTGISITTEAGAGIEGIASAKKSTTYSVQLGFESSSSFTQMREETVTDTYNIPAHKAVALWRKTNRFTLRISDGSVVGNSWKIQTNSTVKDQFPDRKSLEKSKVWLTAPLDCVAPSRSIGRVCELAKIEEKRQEERVEKTVQR